ncbi:nuclear mitotic apparatus protein 1-like isoform X2 [Penaeus monodon]|uniref:nuclear mitotic apparatus protein 1-like isoform X2 n=1 Tax=Penaeus monodon TaxID=6687 RepID=UPI0018A76F84|nr:nuclear mitotic apparatus protein 1-like isoform X2 [Penaeus monodon]
MQDKLEEQQEKAKTEIKQVKTEYEDQLRDSNIAFNTKEDEAADLKRENRALMLEIGRQKDEIKELKEQVNQAQLHQRRCESEARDHEAETEGLNEQITDLQERSATLQVSCRLCDQIQTSSHISLHACGYVNRCMSVYC